MSPAASRPSPPEPSGCTGPCWRRAPGGLAHLDLLAEAAAGATGLAPSVTAEYLADIDYALSYRHLAGLTDFFRRLSQDGLVPDGSLSFISAA